MPIAAATSTLETAIYNALLAPTISSIDYATQLMSAIASFLAAGQQILPPPATPIPVAPTGVPSAVSIYASSLASNPLKTEASATALAQAISLVAPQIPPVGRSTLQRELSASLKRSRATERDTASAWSRAIFNYYSSGGVV